MSPCSNSMDLANGRASSVQLINLGTSTEERPETSSSCRDQLLQGICQRLLNPSIALSEAAAEKLQPQQLASTTTLGSSTATGALAARLQCNSSVSAQTTTTAKAGAKLAKLRSLPVELLYDDAGLDLFDQITHLPEYYLTAAEADILAKHGADIVDSCVAKTGAVLVELGAGSMRKTKLLLDAVLAGGRSDVTFCALDLCAKSLNQALQALQELYEGKIQLVGLVGTYEQGLEHLQQQQQQQQLPEQSLLKLTQKEDGSQCNILPGAAPALIRSSSSSAAAAAGTGVVRGYSLPYSTCSTDTNTMERLNSLVMDEDLLLLQPQAVMPYSSSSSSSSDSGSCDSPAAESAGSSRSSSPATALDGDATGNEALIHADVGIHLGGGAKGATAKHEGHVAAAAASPHKVIMWLGSSIGNSTREEGAAFLRQLKESAMLPGDVLLVGIDRRNAPQLVQTAYNDPAGVTRAFILNGLSHCKQLLDAELQKTHTTATTNTSPITSSLIEHDFSYFCLYNADVGRHEAYYQADKDTAILLPAAAAAVEVQPADNATSAAASATVVVPIAAGELVHIEYSYKYSRQEVDQLAEAAGLTWVKAWTDGKQQYDLHMFTC